MAYFDFHLHAVFKKFICKYEEQYPSKLPPESVIGEIDLKNAILDWIDNNFLHILESQSSVTQLKQGKLKLGVAGIAPVEAAFTEKYGLFGRLLNSKATRPVDQRYFRLIRDRQISYYQLFIRELNLYKLLSQKNVIEIISRANPHPPSGNLPAFTIGMEGGHSLSRCKIKSPGVPDTMATTQPGDALSQDFHNFPLLNAAESLKHLQQAMWKEGLDLCYIILTHLTYIPEQHLATHAYGMKMIKSQAVFPRGSGITEAGKDVIDAAYTLTVEHDSQTVPAPVLLDIKHMSLKSRLDLYEYRKKKGYHLPIIASHMGVTGYSVDEWKGAIKSERAAGTKDNPLVSITIDRKRCGEWGRINKEFTFNAWSINLMDDDIEEVLKSGGLIGISLDVRILGWQRGIGQIFKDEDREELITWQDFRHFFPHRVARIEADIAALESYTFPEPDERHPLALCFNILHVAWVGKTLTGTDPWKHLCIGSDFDGLIDPLINCRTAERLPNLEKILLKWLPIAESAYREENAAGPLLPRDNKGNIDQKAFKVLVTDLMFENGRRFIEKWRTGQW
jgi:hypothetical protein